MKFIAMLYAFCAHVIIALLDNGVGTSYLSKFAKPLLLI